MLNWIVANWATLLISLGLIALVVAIVCKLRRDKRRGRSLCGGNCAHCSMGCSGCQNASHS